MNSATVCPSVGRGSDGRVVSITGLGSRGQKVMGSNPGVSRSDGICKYLSCLSLMLC